MQATVPNPAGFPAHDLEAARDAVWRMLAEGAANRRAAFHTLTLATVDAEGWPQARTVTLRAADPVAARLQFNLDRRAPKYRDLMAEPRATLHAYSVALKIQLRLAVRITLHAGDWAAEAAFVRSKPMSRRCYAQAAAPGDTLAAPGAIPQTLDPRAQFAVAVAEVEAIDWLFLAHEGHVRAAYARADAWQGRWRAP